MKRVMSVCALTAGLVLGGAGTASAGEVNGNGDPIPAPGNASSECVYSGLDTADSIEGNLHSHGTPMRRLIESGAIRGRNFVQVGLRGYWPPPEVFDWMRDQEMTWHLMHDVWDRGMRPVIADAIARAGDGCDWLYLSVDIDVLDPGFAPGTGTPEPGGMTSVDLLWACRELGRRLDLVGMDVVEVIPTAIGSADVTALVADRVVRETLTGLALRRRAPNRMLTRR
jgi:agmatinase